MGYKRGLVLSIPVVLGYLPVSITFGILAVSYGFSKLEAFLCSALIFAGASQFALISSKSFLEGVLIPLFLNLRHIIYSTILSMKIKISKPYISSFGLTDEVFAISSSLKIDEKTLRGLEFGAYFSWVAGTLFGIYFGDMLTSTTLYNSLIFSISILFLLLLIPSLKSEYMSAIVGSAIAIILYFSGYAFIGVIISGIITPFLAEKLEGVKWWH